MLCRQLLYGLLLASSFISQGLVPESISPDAWRKSCAGVPSGRRLPRSLDTGVGTVIQPIKNLSSANLALWKSLLTLANLQWASDSLCTSVLFTSHNVLIIWLIDWLMDQSINQSISQSNWTYSGRILHAYSDWCLYCYRRHHHQPTVIVIMIIVIYYFYCMLLLLFLLVAQNCPVLAW